MGPPLPSCSGQTPRSGPGSVRRLPRFRHVVDNDGPSTLCLSPPPCSLQAHPLLPGVLQGPPPCLPLSALLPATIGKRESTSGPPPAFHGSPGHPGQVLCLSPSSLSSDLFALLPQFLFNPPPLNLCRTENSLLSPKMPCSLGLYLCTCCAPAWNALPLWLPWRPNSGLISSRQPSLTSQGRGPCTRARHPHPSGDQEASPVRACGPGTVLGTQ